MTLFEQGWPTFVAYMLSQLHMTDIMIPNCIPLQGMFAQMGCIRTLQTSIATLIYMLEVEHEEVV